MVVVRAVGRFLVATAAGAGVGAGAALYRKHLLNEDADAEGVTKRVRVTVAGAPTEEDAVTAARLVARDSLVKTAKFGSDPNWGRVLAAVGMAPFPLDPARISVSFNGFQVFIDGAGAPGARDVDLSGPDVEVTINLNLGDGEATIRTTDLSHAYVEENSAYSS